MESIKFYKLISPYPEDITMNCKLSMSDIDENFLTFKNYDIKDAVYNSDDMSIDIIRNNGDKINIDISSLKDLIDEEIEEALSGYTPGSCDIDLSGELNENGVLTLTWTTSTGEQSTQISGFLVETNLYHDDTLLGKGSQDNPLGISNLEKTGRYKSVLGILDNLPKTDLSIGDRYLTRENFHLFGRLYDRVAMEDIVQTLINENSLWRIPTKEDWIKLFEYAEICESAITDFQYETNEAGEYVGKIAGSVLKSIDFWEGNENFDNIDFRALPTGCVKNGNLEDVDRKTMFWTSTRPISSIPKYEIYGFTYNHDDVLYDISNPGEMYSIRLVMDIDNNYVVNNANVLGNVYNVINIEEIGQAWITINLNYKPQNGRSEQYTYEYEDISNECYVINHWNGLYWERKELQEGDEISLNKDDSITNYTYIIDGDGNGHIVEGESYKYVNNNWRMVIDAGYY